MRAIEEKMIEEVKSIIERVANGSLSSVESSELIVKVAIRYGSARYQEGFDYADEVMHKCIICSC
jgi:hypothetical protein